MPRNGTNGAYSLPEAAFVPGTTISSSAVNDDFSDIATALTGSIAADGQTPITGQLKAAAGSVVSPEYSFTSNSGSGLYSPEAGAVGLGAGGAFGVEASTNGTAAVSAVPSAGGSGYAVGDYVYGPTSGALRPFVFAVSSLSGSAVASVTLVDGGLYSTAPGNPAAQSSSSGMGTGATLTVTYADADMISDENGAYLWTELGASSFMAALMATVSAAALSVAIAGTDIGPFTLSSQQDNYSPAGYSGSNTIKVAPSTAVLITGLSASGVVDQQRKTIVNTNSSGSSVTLAPNSTSSLAANRFLVLAPVVLAPSQSVTLQYDQTSGGWRAIDLVIATPIHGSFKNLKVTNGSSNTTQTITVDSIILQDAAGNSYRARGVSVTANGSLANQAGGTDGAYTIGASTLYSFWVIYNPGTNTLNGIISTSASAPTLPTGYTLYARVGWSVTDASSNWRWGIQYGRRFQFVVNSGAPAASQALPIFASGSNAGVWTNASISGLVPSTASVIRAVLFASGNVSSGGLALAPNLSYGNPDSATNPPPMSMRLTVGSQTFSSNMIGEMTLESTNVGYYSQIASTGAACLGWEDNL